MIKKFEIECHAIVSYKFKKVCCFSTVHLFRIFTFQCSVSFMKHLNCFRLIENGMKLYDEPIAVVEDKVFGISSSK